MTASPLLFVSVPVFLYVIYRVLTFAMRPKGYPPGPPTIPILGNLHQLPMKDMHLQFQKWAEQYGPIVSLKLGAQTMILLNKDYVVRELFDKRSNIYSARMDLYIAQFGERLNVALRSNDHIWRRERKIYHLNLNSTVADNYVPYQEFETVTLAHDLLHAPEAYVKHLKRYTTSLGSTIIYGWRTISVDQPLIKQLFEWTGAFSLLADRAQLVDFFPFLRPLFTYIPSRFSWFKRELMKFHKLELDTWIPLFETVKRKHLSGVETPCFSRSMLLNQGKSDMTEKEIAFAAGHGFAAASDTTLNTFQSFIKAMVLYPQARHKAQEEIDRVVGSSRLPNWKDFDELRYTRQIVKEVLRWHPVTLTGGIPHCAAKQDEYMGYTIPAGAGLINSVWTINNDPSRASNPRDFNPDRYDGDRTTIAESAALGDASKRDHFTFGAGRRICPGIHVAERSLFIAMSCLLWAFDFDYDVDEKGDVIPIERDAMTTGVTSHPLPLGAA